MASEKIIAQKQQQVEQLSERLNNSLTGVVVSYEGISVSADTQLRKELREAGVEYTVIKNTILSRAAEKVGLEEIKPVLEGTTALATSPDDYAAAARIICKFKDEHKTLKNFNVKIGFMEGKVIGVDQVEGLAKLPPKDQLISLVLGAFNAPIAAFARVLNAIVEKENEPEEQSA